MKDDDRISILAKKIANEEALGDVSKLCDHIFSEIFTANTESIVSSKQGDVHLQEKCRPLLEILKRHGITEKFSDKELCELTHEVLKIKLLRAA